MRRLFALFYGVVAYMLGLISILYAIGFVGNVAVPKTIDVGGEGAAWQEALLTDLLLIAIFAIPHSLMARKGFKRWWTRIVPEPIERSTYVLTAAVLFLALFWFWEPITQRVWHVEAPALRSTLFVVYFMGWGIVLLSTFLIDHFNLFGLAQVFGRWRERKAKDPEFQTPSLYKLVRHPLYFGLLLAFWATPDMTTGHLVFAIANTAYILIGIMFEERDLVSFYGDDYRDYRRRVPMVLPFRIGGSS
jgi:protein-S-isoprenylcysteine O-methyltransferase Ste14